MPKQKTPKTATIRIRVDPALRDLFERAGAMLGLDVSSFLRLSAMEKIDQLRTAGKKL